VRDPAERAAAGAPAALIALLAPLALLALLTGTAATAAAPGSPLGSQLVQLIDVSDGTDHADISVQFACTVSYLGNTPLDRGTSTTITLRLGPDCGSFLAAVPPELPLVGGGGELVTGARVDALLPGQATLELTWSRALSFVMAPTADGQGLRIRLLGTGKRAGGYVAEVEAPEGYAVNLDSSLERFDPGQIQAAATALATQVYVSEMDLEEKHWYRLRAGPFTTRAEAERVLRIAQSRFPRAWLAINDEATQLAAVDRAGVQAIAADGQTDPPLPDAQRMQILRAARAALARREYPRAIELLTRLLRQPEYAERADAQELIGLVHERAGELAHAKAEYQEYLRRYPDRPEAERVRSRLSLLASAALPPQYAGEFGGAPPPSRWSVAGSAALTYQYGQDQITSGGSSTSSTSLDAALIYGDLLVRERGARYDFTARVDAGYTANMVANSGGSQDRTTAAYIELTDRQLGLTGRAGRQSLATIGAIGLFDGLYAGYQVSPKLTISVAGGLPAYSSYSGLSGQQEFGTVSAEYGPFREAWIFDGYLFDEISGGTTDRRALGFQARYSRPGRSAVFLTDYDIAFQQLNSATLIGNLALWKHWVLGFDADHRRSPMLLLSDALIGQSAPDIATLQTQFTPSQIRRLALDRTSMSDAVTLSASHPIGQRWQFLADVSGLELSGTPASGGVAATPATGWDKNASLQISGSSLLQASDLHFFGVRVDDSPSARSLTLSWDARFVLAGAWRLGPRFSVEELQDPGLGGTQRLFLPEVRSDWTGRKSVFELIAGYQLQQQLPPAGQGAGVSQDARHLYASAAYRLRF
jgi:tetratricopeptide (TPR) repeat protein